MTKVRKKGLSKIGSVINDINKKTKNQLRLSKTKSCRYNINKIIKVKGMPAAAKKNIIEFVEPFSLTFEKSNALRFKE